MSARGALAVVGAIFLLLVLASAALMGDLSSRLSWSFSDGGASVSASTGTAAASPEPAESGSVASGPGGSAPAVSSGTSLRADDPVEWRLLRTLQIGAPQGLSVEEIVAFARGSEADFTSHVLARAALAVIREDRGFPDWPLDRLLARTLAQLQRPPSSAYDMPEAMPGGFNGEHLVLATVYALVVSGQEEAAIDALEAQLSTGSDFKRAVVLQALRAIGTDRATGIVQQAADETNESLPGNLLADYYYPFLHELHDHWRLVPPDERSRENLVALATTGCGRPASVAAYLLGFFAPATEPAQESAELETLRHLTRLGPGCYYNRFFAIRSLALRSPESIDFWVNLYGTEEDAWQRAQLARIGFALYGRDFLDPALALLADEPVQYVQWELAHANIELREGARWRPYWDIWLAPTLQFRLDFPEHSSAMSRADLDALLEWFESGAHPRHPWVHNHMLYGMARHVRGETTRQFLRVFNAHPEKATNWWILSPLTDPSALPLLRYWATLETTDSQRAELERNIRGLESRRSASNQPSTGGDNIVACCAPTRQCLQTIVGGTDIVPEVLISTEDEARAWLAGDLSAPPPSGPEIAFLDELERIATVTWPRQDRGERWEHVLGCWQRIEEG